MHLEVAPTPSDSSAARIRQRIRRVKRAGYDPKHYHTEQQSTARPADFTANA